MKLLRCLLIMLPLIIITGVAFSQKKVITGKITDQTTGEPLSGVTILANKSKNGFTAEQDGTYSITVDPNASLITFSYVGFQPQTVLIDGRTSINVSLTSTATLESEVVVIGYGTQKRGVVTGAISKFKPERLEETPSSRLDQALQGKIAGVQIQNTSSEAGSDPKVRVRGLSSVGAGANPLVVVDGHPIYEGLSFVNTADVESVEVLKDAASAAIYGSRGANGVIIVTTKSGKADRPKYSLKYSYGNKQAYKLYPMMTTTDYTNMLFEEAALKSTDPSIPPQTINSVASTAERAAYVIEQTLMGGIPTDWQKAAIRNANVQNLQLGVSGGTKAVKYYFSGGYQKDQGMMYHSEYERFNIKSKVDVQLGKRIKLSVNINPSYIKRERPSVNYIDFVRFQSYLPVYLNESTAEFVRQNPIYADVKAGDFAQARYFNGRVYNGLMPDGSTWVNTAAIDPFATSNNTPKSVMETRKITSNDYRVLTSGDLTVNILPGLDFKTLGSAYISFSNTLDFAKRNSNRAGDVNKGIYNNRTSVDLLSENTLNYTKQFGGHSFNLLAGFTSQKTRVTSEQTTGLDYPSDDITTLNTALTIDQANTFNSKYKIGLISYLGRLIYSYQNKYLLSASYRADGSSLFAPGYKWGYFPSVSLGWVASQEKFMKNVNWLNNLKLRASYGLSGNNNIDPFGYVDLLYISNYPSGSGNISSIGLTPSRDILAKRDITWERTRQFNGGIDISVLKSAISLTVDLYKSKTEQLLLRQSAVAITGVPFTYNNIGSLKNNGIELELTTKNFNRKNFRWTTSANFAHNKNEVIALGDESKILNQGERTEVYMNQIGGPLIQFFGYKTDGVWLSQADITAAQQKGLSSSLSNVFVAGGLKLVDINGDNKIDANDRTVIGNPYPDFTYGISNNFNYKNFDLSFLIQGSKGGSLVNGDPNYNETKRYNRNYNQNRWLSPMFPGDGKTPYSTVGFNWMLTDYVIEDASYYALREVLVGYTLPANWVKKAKLSSLRFYFSAQNLFFHTPKNYRGINSEARFSTGPYNTPLVDGYQRGSFPMNRTYLFGVDLNF